MGARRVSNSKAQPRPNLCGNAIRIFYYRSEIVNEDHITYLATYTRQEAIADGVLVDCTEDFFDDLNRNAGVIFDVAMTRAVFERYIEVPEAFASSQDMKGRYWDLLYMFRLASKKNSDGHELLFEFLSIPNGNDFWSNERTGASPEQRLVQLKAVAGPGDRGEPCLAFMLPGED